MKPHWMKFYPADWQSDIELRSCSLAARGLWVELICIMQKADPRGYLLVNGKKPTMALLAVLCGCSERDVSRYVAELEDAGVFSRDGGGVIYSRRILRDIEKAATDKANGAKGGNPNLKGGVNPPDKPTHNGVDKAQILEARSQNKPSSIEAKETGTFEGERTREVSALRPLTVIGGAA